MVLFWSTYNSRIVFWNWAHLSFVYIGCLGWFCCVWTSNCGKALASPEEYMIPSITWWWKPKRWCCGFCFLEIFDLVKTGFGGLAENKSRVRDVQISRVLAVLADVAAEGATESMSIFTATDKSPRHHAHTSRELACVTPSPSHNRSPMQKMRQESVTTALLDECFAGRLVRGLVFYRANNPVLDIDIVWRSYAPCMPLSYTSYCTPYNSVGFMNKL